MAGFQPSIIGRFWVSPEAYKRAMVAANETGGRMPRWFTVTADEFPRLARYYEAPAMPAKLQALVGEVEAELGEDVATRVEVFDADPILFFRLRGSNGRLKREKFTAGVWGEDPRFASILTMNATGGAAQ